MEVAEDPVVTDVCMLPVVNDVAEVPTVRVLFGILFFNL